jgi:Rrf2 family protein
MRVSTKGDYGVRALIELAHHFGEGPLQSSEIAARQRIPEPYLDQLLTTLRRAGFIRSVRGPQGGHQLIRDPYQIRLTEAISALEGSLAPIACLEAENNCPHGSNCSQRGVWDEVQKATLAILDANSIGSMAEREREAAAGARYYI